jgi:hypothetical protein
MPKLNDVKIGGKFFGLFVGPPGSGKDIGAASWPGPVYTFDLDKRIDSVAAMYPNHPNDEFDQYGPDDFEKLWNKVKQIQAGNSPFRTYILSSLTALARMGINYSISMRGNNAGGKTKVGLVQMTEVQDFNAESRILSIVLDAFRGNNFKSNFIMTAHLVETNTKKLDGSDVTMQRVLTGGKTIGAEIPGYFNEIYLFNKKLGFDGKAEYKMTTNGEAAGISTKTILPIPGEIDFTMKPGEAGLYEKIKEACKAKGIEIG